MLYTSGRLLRGPPACLSCAHTIARIIACTIRPTPPAEARIPLWPIPDAAALTPLEQLWAYITLAVTPIVTEELAPILGGLAVSQGQLGMKRVIVAVAIGGWIATALLYALGRWRGRWVRRRFPRAGRTMKRTLRAVRRRPWQSAIAVRFAFGARLLLPLACGAAHVRPDVYLAGTLVSSMTWSALFVFVGYWFGDAALRGLNRVRAYDQYAAALFVGLAVVAWLMVRRRRRTRVD